MQESPYPRPPSATLDIWRVGASGVVSVVGFAALIPFAAIRLESLGHSAAAIGAFSALPWLAILVIAPFVPQLVRQFGGDRLYVWGALAAAPLPLVFALTADYVLWCIANFAIGLVAAMRWIVSEAWVADLAPADRRGRVVGLYETFLGASFAAGPLMLVLLDPATDRPAYAGAILWLAGWLFAIGIAPAPAATGDERNREHGFAAVLSAIPAVLIAAGVGGVFEVGLAGIGSYWALTLGFGASVAAVLAAALGVGSFAAQYPAGWLADHAPASSITRTAFAILIVVSVLAVFVTTVPASTIAVAIVWGGVGGGLYTLSMIGVSQRFSGAALMRATSAVVFAYTLGGTIGPSLIGMALDAIPRDGMPLTLAFLSALALVAHMASEAKWRKPKKGGPPHPPERRP